MIFFLVAQQRVPHLVDYRGAFQGDMTFRVELNLFQPSKIIANSRSKINTADCTGRDAELYSGSGSTGPGVPVGLTEPVEVFVELVVF